MHYELTNDTYDILATQDYAWESLTCMLANEYLTRLKRQDPFKYEMFIQRYAKEHNIVLQQNA